MCWCTRAQRGCRDRCVRLCVYGWVGVPVSSADATTESADVRPAPVGMGAGVEVVVCWALPWRWHLRVEGLGGSLWCQRRIASSHQHAITSTLHQIIRSGNYHIITSSHQRRITPSHERHINHHHHHHHHHHHTQTERHTRTLAHQSSATQRTHSS